MWHHTHMFFWEPSPVLFRCQVSDTLIYCLLFRGTVIISFLGELKRKSENYWYRKVWMWFQNLPLNLCDQKRKPVLYRLFFFFFFFQITDGSNCVAAAETCCDVGLGKEYTLVICFNSKYLTFLFFLWILCHFCTSVFCFFVISWCFACCFVLSCTGRGLCYLYQ